VAVLEFSGNAFTPCMQDPSGVPLQVFAATNTRVLLMGTPASRRDADVRDAVSAQLNAMYSALAGRATVRYADAARRCSTTGAGPSR
jgi:hypothetical protein